MDAPQLLSAVDPCRCHAAAAAGQYWNAGWRTERAARTLEHSGRNRLRDGVPQPTRIYRDRQGGSGAPDRLPCGCAAETVAAERDELYGELRSLRSEPIQSVLRQECHQGQRI